MTPEQIEELRALLADFREREVRGSVYYVNREADVYARYAHLGETKDAWRGSFDTDTEARVFAAAANHMDALLSLAAQAERMREALEAIAAGRSAI